MRRRIEGLRLLGDPVTPILNAAMGLQRGRARDVVWVSESETLPRPCVWTSFQN